MDVANYRFGFWRTGRGGGGECEGDGSDEQEFIEVRARFNARGTGVGREGLKVFKNPLVGVMPQSHKSSLKNLALCDGRHLLFSCSRDGMVLSWDIRSKVQICLKFNFGLVYCMIASDDGSLVVASQNAPIQIISLSQEKPVTESLPNSSCSKLLKFSKQNTYLISYSNQSHISIWDFKTRKHLKDISIGDQLIITLTFTYDNKNILVLTEDEDLITIELDSGEFETITKTSLVFLTTGNKSDLIATASDKSIIAIKSKSNIRNFDSGHISHVNFMQFNDSDSNLITSSYDKTLKILKLDGEIEVIQVIKCETTALAHAINHDFSLIYLGFEAASPKNAIRVFNRKIGEFEDGFNGHYYDIADIIVFKDLIHVLTDAKDGAFRIWNRETGKMVKKVEIGNNLSDLVLSENEKMIAYVLKENIYVRDLDNDKVLFKVSTEYSSVFSLFFINHDKNIVFNQGWSLSFVNNEKQKIVRTLKFNHHFVKNTVKIDERYFLQNSREGYVKFWEVGESQKKLLDMKLEKNIDIFTAIFDKTRKYIVLTTYMQFIVIKHNFDL